MIALSRTLSRTLALSNSCSFARSPALSLALSRTIALSHSCSFARSPALSLALSLALALSRSCSFARSPALSLALSLALSHSRALALPHSRLFALPHYWAELKRYTRENCRYTFSELEKTVLEAMESVDFEDNPALCHEEQKVDIGIYERVDSRAESICKEGVQVSQARNTAGFCVN